ncbi:cytochrome c peroxidase [Roseisolibacter sp. H3M3-2]|uniref:cytochrome-c peroxidase n=1 Tax=Roseisolibacter sp. H3M3-2 TaxID=3031323 RepID=UPI0023DB5F90|nr:cytochrome c peroxidase [Roseisolibacter sp. H3M3-2]MDF1503819.1 cytochrome c peroxidase [Roseisolibacter sp. H3M3-2]
MRTLTRLALLLLALGACAEPGAPERLTAGRPPSRDAAARDPAARGADAELRALLAAHGFTGRVASTLEARLGRRVDPRLADVGRLLWFDPILALNGDNACAGCHSPTHGLGDTQSIAIGIDNNRVVGAGRRGPRNQRRSPMAVNAAFYPTLMWNSRFRAASGDPFDNRAGFDFPAPEGRTLSHLPHLLAAQAFIPPTERVEAAGFAVPGDNDALRAEVLRRLNAAADYRRRFAPLFAGVRAGAPITFEQVGLALAEFQLSQVHADAPIDRFARGEAGAMTAAETRGAVLFFGRAGCVGCHAVSGRSSEMFSDFREHVIGVPQVAPTVGNVPFDGPGADEDFGLAQVTGDPADRYAFRTAPLRNVALQPAFMHNGAFVRLEDAVRHHLDPARSARAWTPALLAPDLRGPPGPIAPVLARLDPRLRAPARLDDAEVADLVAFVRDGLLDPAARPERLRHLVPARLPSGLAPLAFASP